MHPTLDPIAFNTLGLRLRQVLHWGLLATALHMGAQPSSAQSAEVLPAIEPTQPAKPLPSTPSPAIGSSHLGQDPSTRQADDARFVVLPDLPPSTLPRSALLNYRLSGLEKGIQYQANSQLRWQHNTQSYDMNLSLKVFLLGTKSWHSQGQITSAGLAPTRLTDRWRNSHTAFFDRPNQRIVFDQKTSPVPLQMGAQDQVSLYAQLAAAMTHVGESWPAGTRLQMQTATARGASPWLLTLVGFETLPLNGQNLPTTKWLGQRMSSADSKLEFWVNAAHDWLPVRIRITQDTGSFIDLQLTNREALPDLPLAMAHSPP